MSSARGTLLRRGLKLEAATILWNIMEGFVAIIAGAFSSSVALIGFGIDSFVETASAAVVGWRLRTELQGNSFEAAEKVERTASRAAGALLLLLGTYIMVDAGRRLFGMGAEARPSPVGIGLTIVSLAVMPFLGRVKLTVATKLGSAALRADAFETIACSWLSLTTLSGLALNALLGWWWADPLAALILVPLIVREGLEGWKGEQSQEAAIEESWAAGSPQAAERGRQAP